jgi:uncharacterized protein YjiS (DUF1127 family)
MLTIARRLPRIDTLSSAFVIRWCRRLYDSFVEWQQIVSERESLARLDDRLLADIGLTREQQMRESAVGPHPDRGLFFDTKSYQWPSKLVIVEIKPWQ